MAHPTTSIFDTDTIEQLVSSFDFSKIDVKDNTRDDYLHIGLAPSYGSLKDPNPSFVQTMDDELFVMIAATIKDLEAMPQDKRSMKNVTASLMQNLLLEPGDEGEVHRSDKLLKKSSSDFKFDGSPNAPIVQEFVTWLETFIADPNILCSTKLDANVMAKVVTQIGTTVNSLKMLFYGNERHTKDIVDITVLRFPDPDHPYFKVYRIKLHTWSNIVRVSFHPEASIGIVGEFWARIFKPRKSAIDQLDAETKRKAVEEAKKKLNLSN